MATKNSTNNDWTATFLDNEKMARRYESAEIVTRPFGHALIEKASLLDPKVDDLTILDNACGTGVVAATLHEMIPAETRGRMKLTLGDFSEPMLKVARERCEKEGWVDTDARIVDAQKTGLPDATFSHVLTNFAVMGLQDPTAAINECHRILKPGGICAFTTWAFVDWVAIVRSAFATLPGPPPFPSDLEMYRSWGAGDWYSPEWIRSYLSSPDLANTVSKTESTFVFEDIVVETMEKDLVMPSPEMFVDTFSVMVPMLLKKFWTEQQREELGAMAVPRLLEWMQEKYGKGKEVKMHWAANIVVAKKPFEDK
ncbi:MAG: hypothetical protein Q9209_002490 [Squamulea sp. 1 TL-2023]